jgi:MMPL family
VVSRWREERAHGDEAVQRAMQTAGRAVVFSGITVAIGLLALIALPLPFLRSMGDGGMLIPVVSVLVAITLLPVARTQRVSEDTAANLRKSMVEDEPIGMPAAGHPSERVISLSATTELHAKLTVADTRSDARSAPAGRDSARARRARGRAGSRDRQPVRGADGRAFQRRVRRRAAGVQRE